MFKKIYMQRYKTLKEFTEGPDEAKVTYEVGAIVEMEAEGDLTKELLANGAIEPAPEVIPSTVSPEEAINAPEPVAPTEVVEEEKIEEPVAPTEVAESIPVRLYRGSVILSEEPRTVGAQTFRHIKTAEGHDYDLTEEEYKTEVTIAQ